MTRLASSNNKRGRVPKAFPTLKIETKKLSWETIVEHNSKRTSPRGRERSSSDDRNDASTGSVRLPPIDYYSALRMGILTTSNLNQPQISPMSVETRQPSPPTSPRPSTRRTSGLSGLGFIQGRRNRNVKQHADDKIWSRLFTQRKPKPISGPSATLVDVKTRPETSRVPKGQAEELQRPETSMSKPRAKHECGQKRNYHWSKRPKSQKLIAKTLSGKDIGTILGFKNKQHKDNAHWFAPATGKGTPGILNWRSRFSAEGKAAIRDRQLTQNMHDQNLVPWADIQT
jgi:hypothetical protein